MKVIRWSRSSRKFCRSEVDRFYHGQMDQPTLFRFTTNHTELPEHGGKLSLKLVLSGKEEYRIERRTEVLRPGQFLLINDGQHYSSRITEPTESVSIFLPSKLRQELFLAGIHRQAHDPEEDPGINHEEGVPQIPFTADPGSLEILQTLIGTLDLHQDENPAEMTSLLVISAIRNLHGIVPFTQFKAPRKSTTRHELIRRLMLARSSIDDSQGRITSLDALASTACLSKYYFLRLFTELFNVTPGAYARKIRLNKAIEDIQKGVRPARAAKTAGYDDFRAFRRSCQRILNLDPIKNSQFQTRQAC